MGSPRAAFAGGVLGIVSVAMVFLTAVVLFGGFLDGGSGDIVYVIVFGSVAADFVAGLLAVILASYARLRRPWGVVGLVTGILSMVVTLFGFLLEIMAG